MAVAVRIRVGIREAFEGHPVPVTISSGIATQRGGGSREAMMTLADRAMYEAKRQGRDRTVAAEAATPVVEGAPEPYSLAASSTK
jgi:PleD family two-component response regulator